MLSYSPYVEEVLLGENGVLEGHWLGGLVVNISTFSQKVSVEIAQKVKKLME